MVGVDFYMGNEESGEFRFLKKKQNITIGRKESKEGRQSGRNSKERILRLDSEMTGAEGVTWRATVKESSRTRKRGDMRNRTVIQFTRRDL